MSNLVTLLEVGLAGAAVNIIVTRSSLFRKVREGLMLRNRFLGELVYCPLCFGTWTGLLLGFILDLRLFEHRLWFVDWFFSSLAAVTLIVPLSFAIYHSMHHIFIDDPQDE